MRTATVEDIFIVFKMKIYAIVVRRDSSTETFPEKLELNLQITNVNHIHNFKLRVMGHVKTMLLFFKPSETGSGDRK